MKIVLIAGLVVMGLVVAQIMSHERKRMVYKSYSLEQINDLFSVSEAEISESLHKYKQDAERLINQIMFTVSSKQNYVNTVEALDQLLSVSDLAIVKNVYAVLEMVSPKKNIRNAAHAAILEINDFLIDKIFCNKALYLSVKQYADMYAKYEKLTAEQQYFLQDVIKSFERQGLNLSQEKFEEVKQLQKEISVLALQFERNISDAHETLDVPESALNGLQQEFINGLRRRNDGRYMLGVDSPTIMQVLTNCAVEETRKQLFRLYNKRGYPVNEGILKAVLEKRNRLANLLGYPDFASYDLADQMVKTPQRALDFLKDLKNRSDKKVVLELEQLKANIPDGVQLAENGKFNTWDVAYVQAAYKKKHFNIDERVAAEYFPLEQTIDGLLSIYQSFFAISLETVAIEDFWHDEVRCIQVFNNEKETSDKKLIGTILLDLHPREGKYSHACSSHIIPAFITDQDELHPGLVAVITNFPRATTDAPALLQRTDVQTFFHEFGHALHTLLGATKIAALSGTNTKVDFVELPSQMLEEWLSDKEILRMISCHYKTGEPLPDWMIDNIIALKKVGSGLFVQRQIWLSRIALDFHSSLEKNSLQDIVRRIHEETITASNFDPENHMYTAFGHLCAEYNAKYYGYLWSRVFALDLFDTIKKHGLLNPEIGCLYKREVLEKGGAQDPNELLINFLHRSPNSKAFFAEMGLDGDDEFDSSEQTDVVGMSTFLN